jgi:hypothetical protein
MVEIERREARRAAGGSSGVFPIAGHVVSKGITKEPARKMQLH